MVDKAKSVVGRFTNMPIHIMPLTMRFTFEDITPIYVQRKLREHKLKAAEIAKATSMSKEEATEMLKSGSIPDWCKPILYFYFFALDTQVHYAKQLGLTAKMLARK